MIKKFLEAGIFAKALISLSGQRVAKTLVASFFVGISVGIVEILFGLGLEKFLVDYDLLESGQSQLLQLPDAISPLVFILIMGIALTLLRYFAFLIPHFALLMFMKRIRNLVNHETMAQEGDVSELSVANVSHIMTNLSTGAANYINAILSILLSVMRLFVLLAGLFFLSTELSMVAIVSIIIFGIPTIILRRYFVKLSELAYREGEKYSENIVRNVRNVLFLKLSGKALEEREKLEGSSNAMYRHLIKYNYMYYLNVVWPQFLSIFVVILVVLVNAEEKLIAQSTLVPFAFLLSRIAAAISEVTAAYGRYQIYGPACINMVNYNEVLLAEREKQSDNAGVNIGSPTTLHVEDLKIGRRTEVLSGLNLRIESGDLLLITGKSGSGKTTFIHTLLGLIPPLSGGLLWNGVNIKGIEHKAFRSHVAYSGADAFLFDGTIEENILMSHEGKLVRDRNLERVLKLCACEFINELDGKLSHLLKEGGEGISAGQKQRISLARALLSKPQVLILDEATSNIDEDTEKKIFEGLRAAYPAMIIILVSHRESTRGIASKILQV